MGLTPIPPVNPTFLVGRRFGRRPGRSASPLPDHPEIMLSFVPHQTGTAMRFIQEFKRLREARRASKDVVSRLDDLMGRSNRIATLVSFWVIAQWSLGFPETLTEFSVFDLSVNRESLMQTGQNLLAASWQLVVREWPYIILAVFTYWWFSNYRNAVEHEIGIVDAIFHKSRKPKSWQKVSGRTLYSVLSVLIVITFLALAAALHRLELYCTIVMGLWLQDTLGNASIRHNLRQYLDDDTYHLPPDHPDAPFFERKREIARHYWLEKPHLERIALMIFLTVVVLMLTISEELGLAIQLHPIFATGLMSAVILANELTMKGWRQTRDADILEAETDHHARIEGTPDQT